MSRAHSRLLVGRSEQNISAGLTVSAKPPLRSYRGILECNSCAMGVPVEPSSAASARWASLEVFGVQALHGERLEVHEKSGVERGGFADTVNPAEMFRPDRPGRSSGCAHSTTARRYGRSPREGRCQRSRNKAATETRVRSWGPRSALIKLPALPPKPGSLLEPVRRHAQAPSGGEPVPRTPAPRPDPLGHAPAQSHGSSEWLAWAARC